jgi:DNA polymerase-1
VLAGLEARLTEKQAKIQAEIDGLVGRPLYTGSGDKVADFLFRELGLVPGRLTPSQKRPQVGEDALLKLRDQHPVVPLILEWRGVEKLLDTYIRPLPGMRDENGRIHTRLKNTTARTGRLASEEPNLQNQPIQDEDGRLIRSAFCAGPGCVIADLDLSQIEMVVAAHESKDPKMREIFRGGLDIHIKTACALFGLDYEQVQARCAAVKAGTADNGEIAWVKQFWQTKRLPSKTLGFQVLYGCAAQGLQDGIVAAGGPLIPLEDCDRYIAGWFEEYSGVRDWVEAQHQRARRYGMVWDMFGRPRLIPEVHSALQGVRAAGLREAGNHPIQSGAGGILKLGMAETQGLVEMFQSNWPSERCWPLLPVHDELLFELGRPIAEDFCGMAKSIMETAVPLDVPTKAEYGIGENWLEAHK